VLGGTFLIAIVRRPSTIEITVQGLEGATECAARRSHEMRPRDGSRARAGTGEEVVRTKLS
jgi:hypothetical protein